MDREIDKAIKKLVSMYGDLETKLLIEIAKHFKYNDKLLNADYWRLQKLDELGALNKKTIKYIAEVTKKTPKEVERAMKKIGYMSYDENKLQSAFEEGKIKVNPKYVNTDFIDREILTSYDEMMNTFTMISDKVEYAVRKTYLDIVDKAYIEVSEGRSYGVVIREAIEELASKGIRTVAYETDKGIRNYTIEGLVRREVLTATRQLNARVRMEEVNELGVEKVKISEHIDCRPTHFDWQGTIIPSDKLVEVTDYGSVTGLCGINCRHYFMPYFGDKDGDDLKKFTKEECEEAYKISQKQRYLERGKKKKKNQKEMFKANGDEDEEKYANKKIKLWVNRIDKFTKDNDLQRDYDREF